MNWNKTADRPPTAADAVELLVWTWTDPASPFEQAKEYNATRWDSVVRYPEVFPLWSKIEPVPK
jgi:hypothetical protein